MQEKHLYEYAVIRVVPKVEREEFLNVGIILFCKKQQFIKMIYKLDDLKIQLFSTELEAGQLEQNLQSFEKISKGEKTENRISKEEPAERFRWLTAVRSACIQTSRPHPGITQDLEKTLQRLFEELVL